MAKFVKLLKNVKGATAIEFGLIAALIAVAAIGAMQGIGNKLNTTFNNVSYHLSLGSRVRTGWRRRPKGAAAFLLSAHHMGSARLSFDVPAPRQHGLDVVRAAAI